CATDSHQFHRLSRILSECAAVKSAIGSSMISTLAPRPVRGPPVPVTNIDPPSTVSHRPCAPASFLSATPASGLSSLMYRRFSAQPTASDSEYATITYSHSGCLRISHSGKYCEVIVDLPDRGGIDTISCRFFPRSTSRTAFTSRDDRYARWGRTT